MLAGCVGGVIGWSAGFAAAPVVFISALAGAPVSMAQAQTSALVGAETVIAGYRRVRWEQARFRQEGP